MKNLRLSFTLVSAALLFAVTACRTEQPLKPERASSTSISTTAPSPATTNAAIPDRPEKLRFPPLNYEPPSPEQYRTVLKSGPIAYVAEDRELPLVNINILVRTGDYLDPEQKTGLAGITGYLLTRGGTETKTAEELEERLAFLAAQLGSGIGGTQGSVGLNLLSKDLEEGLAILREVLATPRFQEDKLALRKQQEMQGMRERNDDSSSIEARESAFLAYGEDFWAVKQDTAASVEAITRTDLQEFHRRWFYPSNFVVAVSGDFSRADMIQKLERLFSDWPFHGENPPPIPTNTTFAAPGVYIVDKDVNQGRVSMMLPGILRDNPDYFPAVVMNEILGGGGFTSRIVNRVRSDEGLAYAAGSRFPGGVYYPLTFSVSFQSKSRTVPYAMSIVMEELKRISEAPVTDMELKTAQRYFIESFPRRFATKAQIVSQFADDEFTGRYGKSPDFWKQYRGKFEAVNKAEIERVAERYLVADKMVSVIVGQKDQILLGHPDHDVKLADLAKGHLTELPLRDPMTMKPLPK